MPEGEAAFHRFWYIYKRTCPFPASLLSCPVLPGKDPGTKKWQWNHMVFLLWIIDMVDCIDGFFKAEPALHT